jgi:hypothetical protein
LLRDLWGSAFLFHDHEVGAPPVEISTAFAMVLCAPGTAGLLNSLQAGKGDLRQSSEPICLRCD